MTSFRVLTLCSLILAYAFPAASQTWSTYTSESSGLAANTVKAIGVDADNVTWFGTVNGLSRFDGSIWTTYTTDDNLAQNDINALVFEITSYGPGFWIGTNGGGVSVAGVSESDAITAATPYTPENTGLASNLVYSAAVDIRNVKWFGTDKGVSTFNGSEWATYTKLDYISHDVVRSIAAAEDGWVFLGTEGGGVSRLDGITAASAYDTDWSAILSDTIYAVFVDSDGVQWFGTDAGVSEHEGNETREGWTNYTTENGLVDNLVYAIAEDINGTMWFGTANGVSSFDGSNWSTYSTADGLAGNTVFAITTDHEGALWFGTDNGVSRYGGDITAVEASAGLPSIITIDGIYPNPFNPAASIDFSLPSEGYAEVDIYSLSGQKIRRLTSRSFQAGRHSVVWNGKDEFGLPAASGVYIVSLKMEGITASSRLTILK